VQTQDVADRRAESPVATVVAAQPDATLAEPGARLDRPFPTSTMDLWLRKLALTYKKCCTPPNRTAPTWPNKEPTGMSDWRGIPRLGWYLWMGAEPTPGSPAGATGRLAANGSSPKVPQGHYQTSTLIAALRLRGPCAP